jgi:hypothetical protein
MTREFDLLGDPIPDNHGNPGANGHIATSEKVNKVRLLVLSRWTAKQIAEELGVSVPTLNRHYFRNTSIKKARATCISEARGRVLMLLEKKAADGNVSAIKELGKMLEKAELEALAADLAPTKTTVKPLGKKQQRSADAEHAASGGGQGILKHLPDYGQGRPN